ncbi:MAG: Lrp/AsnC family transcriptional regulator [Candidatus Micrarchaeota archaeon]
MDEIDKKIIEILRKDAGTPLSKVADMIGIPRPTAYLRFNKLKEQGVIKGFVLVLGKRPDGRRKAAFIKIKDYLLSDMSERLMKGVGEKLAKRSEVIFAAKISRNTVLVVWEGESFHPMEFREVVGVEEIETEVFKTP